MVDALRRTLLVMVTALIIARPLVFGEDPGLTSLMLDNGFMVLSSLWMLTGIVWMAWRFWARRDEWYIGLVEAALGLAVVLFFISAEWAAYVHPARLIAWEWFVYVLAFIVVRHVATEPEVRHGLFAVLLATGVMTAAHGIYHAAAVNHKESAFATFVSSRGFADYLVLLLPGLAGAVLVARSYTLLRFTLAAAILGAAALWLTHSLPAVVAVAAVAWIVPVILLRQHLPRHPWISAAVVGVLLGFTIWGFEIAVPGSVPAHWRATTSMIADHLWLGVGPGNFGGYYPRYMAETTLEKIRAPHNFLLELWATGGVFLLLAVLAALGCFFVAVARGLRAQEEKPAVAFVGRWEFYVGALFGLVLGFALRMNALASPALVLHEGLQAAGRSLVWFIAFALFEQVAWTDRQRVIALTAGIGALLLCLCFSDGIGFSSVAGPLWIAAALALASLPSRPRVTSAAPVPALFLPIPVLCTAAAIYILYFFVPVTNALSLMREAEKNGHECEQARAGRIRARCLSAVGWYAGCWDFGADLTGAVMTALLLEQRDYADTLKENVLWPLKEATVADPDFARPWLRFGVWYTGYREMLRLEKPTGSEKLELDSAALHEAQKRDPNNLEAFQKEIQLHLLLADIGNVEAERHRLDYALRKQAVSAEQASRQNATEFIRNAVKKARYTLALDPSRAIRHFELAQLLDRLVEQQAAEKTGWALIAWASQPCPELSERQKEAASARRLNAIQHSLTDRQSLQAEAWANFNPDG